VRVQAAKLVPDADIVLVDIDEKSLARMEKDAGRWPWPRVVHAELVEGLAAQRPRAIVFDIAFTEADKPYRFGYSPAAPGPERWERYLEYLFGQITELLTRYGDKVLYGKYSGTEVTIDGEQLLILRESDVLAVIN